jgi:hypothetical protein
LTEIAVVIREFEHGYTWLQPVSSRAIHCWAPLWGRNISTKGMGTVMSNEKLQLVRSHMSRIIR